MAPAGVANGPAFRVFPNPSFGGAVRIELAASHSTEITAVDVLDVGGRRERTLVPDVSGGIEWNGNDEQGRPVRAGIHFVRPVGRDGKALPAERLVIVR